MTPRERILGSIKGLETDVIPYQEVFFQNTAVAEYFGGPQKTFDDAVRYLANSGQCSALVSGFWWAGSDNYQNSSSGEQRYAGGRIWTMDDVRGMQEPDIQKQLSQLKDNIEVTHDKSLASHIFIMNGFHSASTAMGLENLCYCLYDNPEVVPK